MATPSSLRTVSRLWGADKVEHYAWADKGVGFCNALCGAARAVRDWSEAVVKLNRLILRRMAQVGRRPVVASVNSIETDDLLNLKDWAHKNSYVKRKDKEGVQLPFRGLQAAELPDGFGLDTFGLLIRTRQQAVAAIDDFPSGPSLEVPVRSSVQTVRRIWGADKVEHYGWAAKGDGFCARLCTAALEIRDWNEAVVKLNRLILRRTMQVGRRAVPVSANPVTSDDLINLKSWYHKETYIKMKDKEGVMLQYSELQGVDLPADFGFDKFGLIVRTQEPPTAAEVVISQARLETVGLSPVQMVGQIWGTEKVEHYDWGEKGASFCNKLYTAARAVRDWGEAVVKLNRLILRRSAQVGQREVLTTTNPITPDDLVNLKAWSGSDPYIKKNDKERQVLPFYRLDDMEVPVGFGFDVFGLMVRTEERATAVDGAGSGSRERLQATRKRRLLSDDDRNMPKRARTSTRVGKSVEEGEEELMRVLSWLDEEFAEKEWLSQEHRWCAPIPTDKKVSTVQSFYKAFHDVTTLPIETCMVCYRKYSRAELDDTSWGQWAVGFGGLQEGLLFQCRSCFPSGGRVPACADCLKHMRRGVLSPAAQLHIRLGCEHVYPEELKGLTPVEEKLIALNSCYGFITKYSLPESRDQTVRYPKHVKGHITVFPNSVQELVTKVLPHPLLKVLDDIHVSWQGPERPAPQDLSTLLSVRRRVVEKALAWLIENNPLYADVIVDIAEMESWGAGVDGVPLQIYDRLERNEPSAREKTRTSQLVPPTERGLEGEGPIDIREVIAELNEGDGSSTAIGEAAQEVGATRQSETTTNAGEAIYEISSSGMFALDSCPDIQDAQKLQYAWESLGQNSRHHDSEEIYGRPTRAAVRQHGYTHEPYIAVSRGGEFADSFDTYFFAKTFPTLFPLGKGGPRQAEEHATDMAECEAMHIDQEATARRLVSSRNIGLGTWARMVIERHGGRFATHHVFGFLVFNIQVKSRNRKVSMLSVTRKNFPEVERIVQSLTTERLEKARADLEASGSTSDEGIRQLLRSLSLYGLRQPMSRESRLSIRRKIKSLIVRYGMPAIWFTLNPNDITNPVKLRLAAHRCRDPEEAEVFLMSLDRAYKRAKLAVSDPLSSAIFFHREISLFFEHYVKVGEDSVFGRMSQYFAAVETNERGALHLHGLLWSQGNLYLGSILKDVQDDGQAEYRDKIIRFVDSVFTEDLDQEASSAIQAERSVTSDISSLLQNRSQFIAAFEEEANFCAGASQIHTHSPTCVKYSVGKRLDKRNLCRFKAPWRVVEKTGFSAEGVLQIQRNHSLVNRWNKAIAVGLRHNHDISFIATQCKTMALIYYVTNYATKFEDPVWKRVVAATEVIDVVGKADAGGSDNWDDIRQNKTRQLLMRTANRIFTERTLSQVEVIAHILGHPTEFTKVDAWTFLNASSLYWQILRRWPLLRQYASGADSGDDHADEAILLEEMGQRISLVQAYPHRGTLLQGLSLYDYMSIVRLKRKGTYMAGWDEIQFDGGWPVSRTWAQILRKPGMHAVVCLDGYISMNFDEEEEAPYHRRYADPGSESCWEEANDYWHRAAVQHLALFVPWHSFLGETTGDINEIWERYRSTLPKRTAFLVNNIQLLRRSAEDAKRDARQWAVSSAEADPTSYPDESGVVEGGQGSVVVYRPDHIGSTARLIDVLRITVGRDQVTAGSEHILSAIEKLSRFQLTASYLAGGLYGLMEAEDDREAREVGKGLLSRGEVPSQEQVNSIRMQQRSASREKERMIQGIQSQPDENAGGLSAAEGGDSSTRCVGPSAELCLGPSTSFLAAGRELAETFTLNRRQSIAFRLICRQLDYVHGNAPTTTQLCLFVGGAGGTGKSRIIEALAALFASKSVPQRLLITATSGTAAARVNGITIHSACGFTLGNTSRNTERQGIDGLKKSEVSDLFISGQSRMDWQEKWLLIIDEVSMLGARTLYAVDEQLRRLRGCDQDFGGIPIVLFSGDFHQFRPVQERSILFPSTAISWDEDRSFRAEQRYQHDKAHSLWNKFTTVVMLNEQVRAAEDPELQHLLMRIRKGVQDRTDVDLLNARCYRKGRRIPWESDITVVTPLNRNRWSLNVEAALVFQKEKCETMRIFISDHKWKDGQPTEEEALMISGLGDDSGIPVPAFFMFVPGMPVVVNRNTHQGLKLVNGASYMAVDIIPDKAHPGHQINADTFLHFGPPAAIVLASETTKDFHFVGMPAGTILLCPISSRIPCQRKRPWQKHEVSRRGLPCSAAFACTDYKVQGRTIPRVALELRGTRTTNVCGQMVPSQCDPYSLYVQLSRCPSLDGITLLSEARESDFIGNKVPDNMIAAEERLERLSDITISSAEGWGWPEAT